MNTDHLPNLTLPPAQPILVATIDPGSEGALCIRHVATQEIEFLGVYSDPNTLVTFIALCREHRPAALRICIEHVWASPVMGASSSFRFGENVGVWTGLALAHGHTIDPVTPQIWQRAAAPEITSQGRARKIDLRDVASRRYAGTAALPRITLANCDALLMSDYALGKIKLPAATCA